MYKDKDKQREYQKLWRRARRAECFKDKKCEWCGSTIKLVIHHVDPEDKTSHKIWSWTKERRDKELEKCIILCDKCHRKHHHIPKPLVHGTYNAYYQKKCRCDICRKWKYDSYEKYR